MSRRITLGELLEAVNDVAATSEEATEVVMRLIRTGRVRLSRRLVDHVTTAFAPELARVA